MSKKLPQGVVDQILSLRRLPQRTIAKRVGVSLGAVAGVLASAPLEDEPAPRAVEPPSVEPSSVDDDVAQAEQLVARGNSTDEELQASLVRLARAGRVAEDDRDVARTVAVENATMRVVALREKLKPPPVVDVNEHPCMVQAAQRFRDRAHAVLDRILAGVPK